MDFSYSEEQSALRELARKILEEQATPERIREIERGEERLDLALWRELAKANLLGAALPERFGGSGGGNGRVGHGLCPRAGMRRITSSAPSSSGT